MRLYGETRGKLLQVYTPYFKINSTDLIIRSLKYALRFVKDFIVRLTLLLKNIPRVVQKFAMISNKTAECEIPSEIHDSRFDEPRITVRRNVNYCEPRIAPRILFTVVQP